MDPLRQATHTLKHQIRQRLRQATASAQGTSRVNVTGARNIVVSGTSGDDGATEGTSSRQSVRVRQRAGETIEEAVSTVDGASRSEGTEQSKGMAGTIRTVQTGTGGTPDDE